MNKHSIPVAFISRRRPHPALYLLFALAVAPLANAAPQVRVHPRETNPSPAVTYQRLEWVVDGRLALQPPSFRRDVALQATPVQRK